MSRPKTTAEHRRAGTYRPDRHGRRGDESAATPGRPRKPAWIRDDREASAAWDAICKGLSPGVLSRVDGLILAGACRWYSAWRALDAKLADDPQDYKSGVLAAAAWKQFLACAGRLGLSPTDRTKLTLPPEGGPEDNMSALLRAVADHRRSN